MKILNLDKKYENKVKSLILFLFIAELVLGVLADKYDYPTVGTVLELIAPINLVLFKVFNFTDLEE